MSEPIVDLFALFGPIPPNGAEPGTALLLEAHTRHGIGAAIAVSTRGLYHAAGAGNRETAALCEKSGGRLLPGAVLDPRLPRPDPTLSGARVLCAFPATQGWPVAFAPLTSTLKALAMAGATTPLLFEATEAGAATALEAQIATSGYRGPVVLAGIDDPTLAEAVAVARNSDRVFVCSDNLRSIGEVALAVELLGPDRVVFGSGAISRTSLGAALAILRAAGLSAEDWTKVTSGNARKLLTGGPVP